MDLKVGDIVKLKSGSPYMTIEEIGVYTSSSSKKAKCTWFDGNKKVTELFILEALEKVDE